MSSTVTAATLLPAFLGSLWVFLKSEKGSESRKYWLYAFIGLTIINIQTVAYHLPMNLDFVELKYDAATATSKLQGWIILHWVRVVVAICSGVFALLGFQKSSNSI
ncbi:anthrone oxygenase family protein [Bernardetia sp. OM2101]|uniref:anthrone oxygenase family protein n=1 Tax=Bernardetia sp. OM2101 TaxID=3344876 RepID=UPI0035CF61AC